MLSHQTSGCYRKKEVPPKVCRKHKKTSENPIQLHLRYYLRALSEGGNAVINSISAKRFCCLLTRGSARGGGGAWGGVVCLRPGASAQCMSGNSFRTRCRTEEKKMGETRIASCHFSRGQGRETPHHADLPMFHSPPFGVV